MQGVIFRENFPFPSMVVRSTHLSHALALRPAFTLAQCASSGRALFAIFRENFTETKETLFGYFS